MKKPCEACGGVGWKWECDWSFDGDDRQIPDIGSERKVPCEECGGTGKESNPSRGIA